MLGLGIGLHKQSASSSDTPWSIYGSNLQALYIANANSFDDVYAPDSYTDTVNGSRSGSESWSWHNQANQNSKVNTTANLYISNFSSGINSWNGYGTTNLTGSENGIGGEDNWLKMTCNTNSSSAFRAGRNMNTNQGVPTKFVFKIYIPSSNSRVDGFQLLDGNAGMLHRFQQNWVDIKYDEVMEFEINTARQTTNTAILIRMMDGSATTISNALNDAIYVKGFVVSLLDVPNRAWQGTTSAIPDIISNRRSYDGIGQFDNLNTLVVDIETDTEGSFTFQVEDKEGAGNILTFFNIANAETSPTERLMFYYDTNDDLIINTGISGVYTTHIFPTSVTRGTTSTIQIKSNGTSYEAFQDGVSLGTPTNNDGTWFGDLTGLDRCSIGKRYAASTIYDNFALGYFQYVNRYTTTEEDLFTRNQIT